jgi:hypothetical protein
LKPGHLLIFRQGDTIQAAVSLHEHIKRIAIRARFLVGS